MSGQSTIRAPKRRLGCLPAFFVFLLAGCAFLLALDAVFAPWIYLVGGHTRWLPLWQGSAEARTPAGSYEIFIWFTPSSVSSHVMPSASITGSGYICTPLGERYPLRVLGGASGRIWKDMDGHAFSFSAYYRPAMWRLTSAGHGDWRPSLRFSGRWVGANLEMTDEGSLSRAFLANGALNKGLLPGRQTSPVTVTFHEATWWPGSNSCAK